MTARSYAQYCGPARALDVVGDRWNLLIVRQLLIAPARYQEPLDGLPGVATNLLANRLRDLEAAGVIERRLADKANTVSYALTSWGTDLREPIEGLIRWSTPLMIRGADGDRFQPHWLVLALPALLNRRPNPGPSATIGISVDDKIIQVQTTPAGAVVTAHDGRKLDAVVTADTQVTLGLASGLLTLDHAADLVDIQGDETIVRAIFPAAGSG